MKNKLTPLEERAWSARHRAWEVGDGVSLVQWHAAIERARKKVAAAAGVTLPGPCPADETRYYDDSGIRLARIERP